MRKKYSISFGLGFCLLGLIPALPLYGQSIEPVAEEPSDSIEIVHTFLHEHAVEYSVEPAVSSVQESLKKAITDESDAITDHPLSTTQDTAASAAGAPVVPADTLARDKDYPRYTLEEYRYAEAPRYTILGDLPYRQTHLRPIPAVLTGMVVAGVVTGIHLYQTNAWWSDQERSFHLDVDWGYAAQVDKVGHFYAGYLASYVGYEAFIASGFSPGVAGWFGPIFGLSYQTYVEIEDGFSQFGFDLTDQVANTLGPLFFGLQHYIAALQNAKFKWSFWPNDEYEEGLRDGHSKIIIDDYNGQTVWFSLKMGNILPESLGWPKWLRLAGGYGTYNVDRFDEQNVLLQPQQRFFVALDYDLVELMPDLGKFGNWIVQTADYLRFPAPALQLEPELKFYLAWPVVF